MPEEWDLDMLRQGSGWASSGRMLLFEFLNVPQRLALNLYIGPGPEHIRQQVFDLAHSAGPPFKLTGKGLYKKWNSLYQRQILNAEVLADAETSDLEERVMKAWNSFLTNDLPILKAGMGESLGCLKDVP